MRLKRLSLILKVQRDQADPTLHNSSLLSWARMELLMLPTRKWLTRPLRWVRNLTACLVKLLPEQHTPAMCRRARAIIQRRIHRILVLRPRELPTTRLRRAHMVPRPLNPPEPGHEAGKSACSPPSLTPPLYPLLQSRF